MSLSTKGQQARDIGLIGEKLACKFIEQIGYQILAKNFRRIGCEIDIIGMDHGTIALIEVKTAGRANSQQVLYSHRNYFSQKKQQSLRRGIIQFLSENNVAWETIRVDLLLVIIDPPGNRYFINHWKQAIEMGCMD